MTRKLTYAIQLALILSLSLAGFTACSSKKDSKRPPGGDGMVEHVDKGNPDKDGNENDKATQGEGRTARGASEIDSSKIDKSELDGDDTSDLMETEDIDISNQGLEVLPMGAPGPSEPAPQPIQEPIPGKTGGDPVQQDRVAIHSYYTGASDAHGRYFTDAKDDGIMRFLRRQMEQIEDPQYRADSFEFAKRIKDVSVETHWRSTGQVRVTVKIVRASHRIEEVVLEGYFNNNRQAELVQTSATSGDIEFQAAVTCMDQDQGECENTIVTLDQVRSGEVCKTAFIVHRFGDAHFRMKPYSAYNNDHPGLNIYYKHWANLAENSARYTSLVEDGIESGPGLCPRFHTVGMRTFAVAYGAAFFRISMVKIKSENAIWADKATFTGPLLTPYKGRVNVKGQAWNLETRTGDDTQPSFADTIDTVDVVSNNGKGQIRLNICFNGSKYRGLTLLFDTLVNNTIDPYNYGAQASK